ncbi:hypothetical protein VOLCADRAFT_120847 [Volvox carteri f. nagariensis]|uniref:Glutamine amidotransferase domain-containing protein n=1 Tax=Volvox carteri f. nagariensis TaxID=3068 RepID=D8TVG7_VOLCA|nr:uncharacterized protein VOLCADRAFT_120847 [Volvox carteri f. nagariensis]EFJ48576.1 hypothetical protein VOLCADRAFT_120847 [Volvox carteri f. nagariensis]|eukprot:XP_002950375.1 hypothetical protein VOLCADRAFT_120847 [Volvox carteri f. nagariensis]
MPAIRDIGFERQITCGSRVLPAAWAALARLAVAAASLVHRRAAATDTPAAVLLPRPHNRCRHRRAKPRAGPLPKALGGSVGRNPSGRFVLGVENVVVDVGAAAKCGLRLGPLPPSSPTPPPTSPLPSTSGAPEPERSSAGAANLAFPAHGGGPAAGSVTTAASTEPFGAGAGVAAADAAGGPGRPVATIEAGSHSDHLPVLRLRVLESHGDQVLELPPGASLLAASGAEAPGGTAAHEMWALGDRCLAFQFHPELTTDLVYDKIWTALSASGRLSPEESAAAEAQLKAGSGALDSDLFIQALNGFLRAQHPEPRYPSTSCGTRGPEARAAAEAAAAEATAAATAAAVAEAAASNSVQVAKELRQGLERRAAEAAEEVLGHVRHAAAAEGELSTKPTQTHSSPHAGMAAGTADAELLTALNQEAAVAYGRAAAAAEGASAHLAEVVASQHEPLKAALASLGALEVQLDRLAAVVGSLERESAAVEEQVELQPKINPQIHTHDKYKKIWPQPEYKYLLGRFVVDRNGVVWHRQANFRHQRYCKSASQLTRLKRWKPLASAYANKLRRLGFSERYWAPPDPQDETGWRRE